MSATWAVAAPADSLRAIARLRQISGLAVCEHAGEIWLRGPELDEPLTAALQLIPGGRHFAVRPDNQLIPTGRLVPDGHLPAGPWQLFADWLVLQLPSTTN